MNPCWCISRVYLIFCFHCISILRLISRILFFWCSSNKKKERMKRELIDTIGNSGSSASQIQNRRSNVWFVKWKACWKIAVGCEEKLEVFKKSFFCSFNLHTQLEIDFETSYAEEFYLWIPTHYHWNFLRRCLRNLCLMTFLLSLDYLIRLLL